MSKNKGGRPSKFSDKIVGHIKLLAEYGLTDKQMSEIIGVSEVTFNAWKKKDGKFLKSLKEWKKPADRKVEKSLLQRALGYQYTEVTYEPEPEIEYEDGQRVSMKKLSGELKVSKKVIKEVIPDVLAQIYWLKNRNPKEWRDKQEIEHFLPENLMEKFRDIDNDTIERESTRLALTIAGASSGVRVSKKN